MELPPQGDKLHKSSDHLEKEDVELYSVGTRDTLASHDGVLLSCASHANKVPKLARPPPSPPRPPRACPSPPVTLQLFLRQCRWAPAAESSFGVFRPKPAEDCSGLQDWEQAGVGVHCASFPAWRNPGGGKEALNGQCSLPEPGRGETAREGGGAGRQGASCRALTPDAWRWPQVPAAGPTCLSCFSVETGTSVILPSPSSWEKWPWRGFGTSLD